LKILHINDQAGVACILAKFQEKQGVESKVIAIADKYGIKEYYKNNVIFVEKENFYTASLNESDSYDIIHLHSVDALVYKLRRRYGKKKKIILHYHGTDLRGNYKKSISLALRLKRLGVRMKNKLWLLRNGYIGSLQHTMQQLADIVLVSTPDLLKLANKSNYLPNPVDTELFNENISNHQKDPNYDAITIKTEAIDIQKALNYIKHRNLTHNIYVHDRTYNPTPYKDMPDLLKKYNTYIDIKFVDGKLLKSSSKTALESLACGLQVLNYQLKYTKKLPYEHEAINVVNNLFSIYLSVH
jgi:glycosyltransferase involved in cell wall biosynthesis